MKRLGLMGCGVVANYGHLPVLKDLAGVELVALFDPDAARVREAAAKFGVPHACTSVDAFFDVGLDAVAVTSPAAYHLRNIRDAAARGVHVLCEKPLAMTEDEGEEADRVARAAGIQLYTGFDYRYSPVAMAIRGLVRDGAVGDVRLLRLAYVWDCHGKYDPRTGRDARNLRREGRMLEGGPMVDCGVHQIDLARWWLASEAVRWQGIGTWLDTYEAPDHMIVHIHHANGAHTQVEISYSFGHTSREPAPSFTYDLVGTEGLIRYNREAQRFDVRNAAGTTALPFAGEKNFRGMYEAFVAALETGKPGDLPTAHDGVMATRIACGATAQAIRARAAG
jgi:predicted dehydrogenase